MRQSKETTFGMIKPEAISRGIVDDIFRRIREEGLCIEDERKIIMTPKQVEKIYGHFKKKCPKLYSPMEEYLTENYSIVLKVSGENAIERLLKLRGSSNSSESPPGTIRGDYAKDQNYKKLKEEGKIALNVFHAPDSEKDAKRNLYTFFGEEK